MLRIQSFALETVKSLAPAVKEITAQDPDLGRQLRRAASSIVLNIAEGAGQPERQLAAPVPNRLRLDAGNACCAGARSSLGLRRT